jgi:hypothetical protein
MSKTIVKKCFLLKQAGSEYVTVLDVDMSRCDLLSESYILLAKKEVSFDVPDHEDVIKEEIEALEQRKTKIRAAKQKELDDVDEKIQKLLSIGHDAHTEYDDDHDMRF